MKIAVQAANGPAFTLRLPTGMLFHPRLLQIGLSFSRRCSPAVTLDVPPDALKRLRKALKTYRGLKIVDLRSADGDRVEITL